MERCHCDWLESLGYNIDDIQENGGIIFVVRQATIKYDLPARLFDQLTLTARSLLFPNSRVDTTSYNINRLTNGYRKETIS